MVNIKKFQLISALIHYSYYIGIQELSTLGDQEWSIFQTKLHLLDEFIFDWNQKLEPFTPITLFIKNEIDKYKVNKKIT